MRNFPAAFADQKNLLQGASPVWIFKFFAGGVPYYVSDNAFAVAPWGITTLKWAEGWGTLQEGIGGTLDEFRISEFTLDLFIDPDAAPNMEALATGYVLEESPAFLYLWFYGCADAPQEMFRGYIKEIEIPNETSVRLSLQDESLRLERAMIGTLVTRAAYPYADPDDVGRVLPIPFGTVGSLPAVAVNAGALTSLPASISAVATSFDLTSGEGIVNGAVLQVDDEQILVNAIAGAQVTNCTRGYNLTIATTHLKGAGIWEQKESFDYIISAIPITAVSKIYGKLGDRAVDITAICTVYLGSGGNQHPTYPGKAVVSTPGYLTATQGVDLLINDGLTINDALEIVDQILINNNLSVLDGISLEDTISVANSLGLTDAIVIANSLGVTDTIEVLSNIAPQDSISILNGLGISDGITISDAITVSETAHTHDGASDTRRVDPTFYSAEVLVTNPDNILDGSTTTTTNIAASTGQFRIHTGVLQEGPPPIRIRGVISYACSGDFNYFIRVAGTYGATTKPASASKSVAYTDWLTLTSWDNLRHTLTYIEVAGDGGSGTVSLYEAWWEVEVDTTAEIATSSVARAGSVTREGTTGLTGTVSRSGVVTLTGGVSRQGTVALGGTVSRTGAVTLGGTVAKFGTVTLDGTVALNGDVTRTGTVTRTNGVTRSGAVTLSGNSVANTLIGDQVLCDVVSPVTSMADVHDWILAAAGSASAVQLVGDWPASYSYNGAITEYKGALFWLNDLAFQSRAWFRLARGVASLIYRTSSLTSVKTLASCQISAGKRVHSRAKTSYDEILNSINIKYDRDWSQAKGETAYKGVSSGSDTGSITTYGLRERPELFMFDFVTDADMAGDLLSFYLGWYPVRHWLHEFESFLYDAELDFGDGVTLGFSGNAIGQVLESKFAPGSSNESDTIGLVVVV